MMKFQELFQFKSWDSDSFWGIDTIRIPVSQVWIPPLFLRDYNDKSYLYRYADVLHLEATPVYHQVSDLLMDSFISRAPPMWLTFRSMNISAN